MGRKSGTCGKGLGAPVDEGHILVPTARALRPERQRPHLSSLSSQHGRINTTGASQNSPLETICLHSSNLSRGTHHTEQQGNTHSLQALRLRLLTAVLFACPTAGLPLWPPFRRAWPSFFVAGLAWGK